MEDGAKLAEFRDIENRHPIARVVLGKKLISNGLNCSSVKFVCLVDCTVSMIDYLQMISRIRSPGYVRVLTAVNKNRYFKVLSGYLKTVDWDQCISKHISKFYGLCYSGCILCYNALAKSTLKELIDLQILIDTSVSEKTVLKAKKGHCTNEISYVSSVVP
ncbi:CQS_1a_G0057250.mRNA.1.CDS.1 [Saccharomyces cerevisiae]|nr:CQS_1a_G0057250.mRNA.1.CDS.1 [Saccharomyces cerevisiae]CAI7489630.1 CQS_1a_G0057250.mRNA.1.CDS.1 [Saccharomyces cerevisiae]